ncbi:MAG: Cellulose synthase operon protein D [Paracidovorax wautersii]|uniref:Cellulose synthase operon protein D n=1 Tax=Paracidovorax wautersii TaxID=1177982 RepID=A0A7V8JQK0_9BURK|nr:MAG: Cellulose synthase operon protein D [Paracidovorax wautersii]
MNTTLLNHLRQLQIDPAWSPFLEALGLELEAQLDAPALRVLMARAGQRFADTRPLDESPTLADLAAAMNRRWQPMGWGVVSLEEQPGYLRILHEFCPLPAALGSAGASWATAFVEGVYQAWFASLGVDAALRVSQHEAPDALGSVEFRLERQVTAPVPAAAERSPRIFA